MTINNIDEELLTAELLNAMDEDNARTGHGTLDSPRRPNWLQMKK